MFKKLLNNHEVRVRVAKTSQNDDSPIETEERFHIEPEQIAKIAKDVMKHATIAVGAIIVLSTAAATIREVTVKKTKSADQE